MLESVLITAKINADERLDVVITDIPGAFLHTEMEEEFLIMFEGTLAELMIKVSPNMYSQYLTIGKSGKKSTLRKTV